MKNEKLSVASLMVGTLLGGSAILKGDSDVEDGPPLEEKMEAPEALGQPVREISRLIPAPRGTITDRNGRLMAGNREAYYFALQFPPYSETLTERRGFSVVAGTAGTGGETGGERGRHQGRGFDESLPRAPLGADAPASFR